MILFIGAMPEELNQFANDINANEVENAIFKERITTNQQVMICWTGIGLANAALVLSNLLTKYKIDYVFNLGTAGAIDSSLYRGDFIVIDKTSYSMADSTGFGYVYGQLPNMPQFYETNDEVKEIIKLAIKAEKYIVSNTASSDTFFESNEKVQNFSSKLPFNSAIAEMECASYAQVCYRYGIKFGALKIVSDVIGSSDPNEEQFDKFLPKAALKLSQVGQEIIKHLK